MVIIYDGEYSGLYTKRGHGILSIAGIDFENPENIFFRECRLDSNQTFDRGSLGFVGLSEEEIYSKSRSSTKSSLSDFRDWIFEINARQKPCLLSQNNPKDLEHLENGYERIGVELPFHYRNLDLHSMGVAHHLINKIEVPFHLDCESKLTLGYLSSLVGIPLEPKPHFTAIRGAMQTAEVYSRLFFGKNLLKEFQEFQVPII